MPGLVPPHGGRELRPLLAQGARAAEALARAKSLPKLTVTSREKGDLVMLGPPFILTDDDATTLVELTAAAIRSVR